MSGKLALGFKPPLVTRIANWPGYEPVVANITDMTLWRVGGASILAEKQEEQSVKPELILSWRSQ